MSWLLANTVVAAGLALFALAVGRWLRPSPAVMHGLWLLVMLKLVTPPLFAVPVDVSWLWPSPAAPPVADAPPPAMSASAPARLAPAPPTPTRTARVAPALPRPVPAPLPDATPLPAAAAGTSSAAGGVPWSLLWVLGSAALVGLAAVGAVRAGRRQQALAPVMAPLRAEVEALAVRLGVAVPELRDDPTAAAPYVWSLGRRRLVLPARALLACSPKGRAAVLAHELAHLRRGDHWVARAELALAALLWWHPLFWLARGRMRLWAELACDAIAVGAVPGAGLDYAAVLVDAAARPDPAAPGLTVLASRPAARAAFERRLTMILNDSFPRRASRAWFVPFAALTLGLFTVPTTAQQEREREPVRIEIRVNGAEVTELSPADRRALLELLLRQERSGAERGERGERAERQEPRAARQGAREERQAGRRGRGVDLEGLPSAGELRAMISEGLAEARREIAGDKDLRELGITDEVLHLLDDIEQGKGIESSLDGVVRAAMKGAGKMVMKELEQDPDLKRLGLADGIGKLVTSFLESERNQEIVGDLARRAIDVAIGEARAEIRNDADLKQLGIAGDVEALIDGLVTGKGDFDGDLERVIQKAMRAVEREVGREVGGAEPAEKEQAGAEEPRRSRRSRRVIR